MSRNADEPLQSTRGVDGLNQLPVVRADRIIGLVRRVDLIGWLALREDGDSDLRLREAGR